MGGISSCCCGPRKDKTGEREPLLPKHRQDVEPPLPERVVPKQETLNKIAALVAALHNGKLPSQQQLAQILDHLQKSPIFTDLPSADGPLSQRGKTILEDLSQVLEAVQGLGEAKNWDNAVQDIIHQLGHLTSNPISVAPQINVTGPSPLDAAASELPTETIPSSTELNQDTTRVSDSVKTLVYLLFTSSAFRLLLTDILVTARQIFADFASQIGDVAETVHSGAKVVEGIVRPSDGEIQNEEDPAEALPDVEEIRETQAEIKVQAEEEILKTVNESTERGKAALDSLQQDTPDRIRETVIDRIKSIVRQAQADPRFQEALQTILSLSQKYYELALKTAIGVSNAAEVGITTAVNETEVDAEVNVGVDPHLQRALGKAKVLLERFVGSGRLDSAVHDVNVVVGDLALSDEGLEGPGVTDILGRGRAWLQNALKDSNWLSSEESDAQLGSLYDDTKTLLNGDAPQEKKLKHDLSDAFTNIQGLVEVFTKDSCLQHLVNAVLKLSLDTAYFASISKPDIAMAASKQARQAARQAKQELQRVVLAFILPRIIQAIRVIPLPRVELKSPSADVVLDDLNISSLSFIPDGISITNRSELNILSSDAARLRGNSSAMSVAGYHPPTVTVSEAVTRTKIVITGLRISADDIQYYVNARGPLCLGWKDFGLLTLDVGEKGEAGQGVVIEAEVELAGEDLDISNAAQAFFKVIDVKVDAPGLAFTIKKSRHWIFNSLLLQPLLGPSVREGLSIVLAQQIRAVLESVGQKLGEATRKAAESGRESTTWMDWAMALMDTSNWAPQEAEEDSEESSESDTESEDVNYTPPTVTSTSVTTKGIVRTSHQPATLPEQDTVIAIGIGEQVLKDIPLPSPTEAQTTLVDVQRDALDDLQDGAERVETQVKQAGVTAVQTKRRAQEELLVAGNQFEARERIESKRHGWRSGAFDL